MESNDLIRRSDAKAAIEQVIKENDIIIASCDSFRRETKLRHQQDAFRYVLRELEAIDSVPAAGAGERPPMPEPVTRIVQEARKWLDDCNRPGVCAGTDVRELAEAIVAWSESVGGVSDHVDPGLERKLTDLQEIQAAMEKPFHKAECECPICFDWHDWHQRVISGESI